ncbi:MAG TPA: carboxypeptidase regulatory-like domain-containing protein [Bryobacteraceae bacterium]|jgi:tetratricopeptide (TPR) repeat protein|nr:carboxypeptidase regulatory-like domain-containing protein [Bryobacteraceae bacterium]
MDSFPTLTWIRKSTFLAGLFLLAGAGAWAQTSSIEGTVKGEDGNGLKGATVHITRTDIKGNYKVNTDKKGHYFHAGLPLGTYDVSVEVNGQTMDTVRGVRTKLGDPTEVDFDLHKMAQQRQQMQKAAETGELTKEQMREMSPEQRAALEKQMKERAAQLAKNKALNDAYNAGREALNQAQALKPQVARETDPAKKQELQKTLVAQLNTAIQKFDEGEKAIDPNDPKQAANMSVIQGNLAEAYGALVDSTTGQEQQDALAKAMDAYNKAIASKPDDAALHNNYGLMLARAKKIPEAQTELAKAAQIDPANAGKYYYNLGAVLVNSGQYDPAAEAFKKAIDANPNYADAQYWYATALSSKISATPDGKVVAPPGMKEALEKYLQLKPDGQFAEAAKQLLATISGQIETKYENPNASKGKTKKR